MSIKSRFLAAAALTAASIAIPGTAQAAIVGPAATAQSCGAFSFNVTIIDCAGGYDGNLIQGTLADPGTAAVIALGGASGVWIEKIEGLDGDSLPGIINFGTLLTGVSIFGMHTGNAGVDDGNATFFFSFDAGAGTDTIQILSREGSKSTGLSNAALFKTGGGGGSTPPIPEPATWAMMLLGFGAIGMLLRRRRQTVQFNFA